MAYAMPTRVKYADVHQLDLHMGIIMLLMSLFSIAIAIWMIQREVVTPIREVNGRFGASQERRHNGIVTTCRFIRQQL